MFVESEEFEIFIKFEEFETFEEFEMFDSAKTQQSKFKP
jgi:hypothetical protein